MHPMKSNIALIGFSYSGKSKIGRELAVLLGREFVDVDEEIEKEHGMDISGIFQEKGEEYFRELEHEKLEQLGKRNNLVISVGGGAPTFKRNVDILKKSCIIIGLKARLELILSRMHNKSSSRPLLSSRSEKEIVQLYEERLPIFSHADILVEVEDLPARENTEKVFKKLNSYLMSGKKSHGKKMNAAGGIRARDL